MPSTAQSVVRGFYQRLGILLFVVLLWLPFLAHQLGIKIYESTGEKRAMASKPELPTTWEAFQGYRQAFESFWDDNFGFRSALVRSYNLAKWELLGESGSPSVIAGKDGWLFLRDEEGLENYRRSLRPWTQREIERVAERILARKQFLERFGVGYELVIIPAKSTVYPELMNERWTIAERPSRREQFLEYAGKQQGLPIHDMTKFLIEEKERLAAAEPGIHLFHSTDTHWNKRGARAVALEIQRRLKSFFPDMPLLDEQPKNGWSRVSDQAGGDLAQMLGLADHIRRSIWKDGTFEQVAQLEAVTIPAPRRSFAFTNSKLPKGPRVFVFHDSFGETLRDYLPLTSSKSWFYWKVDFDLQMLAAALPQFVLREVTERYFVTRSWENPVPLREIRDQAELERRQSKWMPQLRDIQVADDYRVLGIESIDHGDCLEFVFSLEALQDCTLDGYLHVSTSDAQGQYVVGSWERLCSSKSQLKAGYRWRHSILLVPEEGKHIHSVYAAFKGADEQNRQLRQPGGELSDSLYWER
jgi:hypothetical protein